MNLHVAWNLLKDTFREWSEDGAADQAAALSYYTAISLAPLLVIIIAIVGIFYQNSDVVRDALIHQIEGLVGSQSALTIQDMMSAAGKPGKSIIAMIIGVVVLLFGAGSVFVNLQNMLNRIWKVEPKPGNTIMDMIKARFFSFAMILGMGFLLLVSLVITTVIAAFNDLVRGYISGFDILIQVVNFVISFGVITLLFAMIYKILPDAVVRWSDVWIGAAVTAFLFSIGKLMIGFYLGHSSVASAYGAAGSVIVILIWVYYSAQILFMGAEFTKVYARHRGAEIQPAPNAVRTEDMSHSST